MDLLKKPVFEALDRLGIAYDTYEHPAVFTSEDADQHCAGIGGTPVKNLFLRNKKGDREYLVIFGIEKRADLKELVRIIGDDRFSFGSAERLMNTLGLTPGSVSPFGLLSENSRTVQVVVDADLRGAERLIFHPNINTASVTISFSDLEKFLASRPNPVRYVTV
ncbi:prolyl-tRNA synthetase associated domain-containing protein [soil metagenome]